MANQPPLKSNLCSPYGLQTVKVCLAAPAAARHLWRTLSLGSVCTHLLLARSCQWQAESPAVTSTPLMPSVLEKSERRLCRKHSKLVLRAPLQPYLNCLLQLKVSFLLLPCCVAESPLMLHYLVSQEWALWLQMLWSLQANLDYLKKWGISLWFWAARL